MMHKDIQLHHFLSIDITCYEHLCSGCHIRFMQCFWLSIDALPSVSIIYWFELPSGTVSHLVNCISI